jgi:hypothetical protein
VPLIVWDPASHATYLVQNSVLTWQAWNPYGGDDFYGGAPFPLAIVTIMRAPGRAQAFGLRNWQ